VGSDQPAWAIAGKSITERLCVFRLDETEHHKVELAATQDLRPAEEQHRHVAPQTIVRASRPIGH